MNNGVQAVCANESCNYEYIETETEVTSHEVNGIYVAIDGIDLSPEDSTITFGGAPCSDITRHGTSLECTLDHLPNAGEHIVKYYDSTGSAKSDKLIPILVPMETRIYPATVQSGDKIHISG